MKASVLILFILLQTHFVWARNVPDTECDTLTEVEAKLKDVMSVAGSVGCADASKLRGLCMEIRTRAPGNARYDDSPYLYAFEQHIYEAACADIQKDSDEVIQKKIQHMWKTLEENLTCNGLWDVTNGSALKYAVARDNLRFIEEAIFWGVHLNRVDKDDGRTLLDYVRDEAKRFKGTEFGDRLDFYYKRLKRHGAKHKSELK